MLDLFLLQMRYQFYTALFKIRHFILQDGDYEQRSRDYLNNIEGIIRIFISDGAGFGNQNIAVTVLDKLPKNKTIEIIGDFGNGKSYAPINKFLKLLNIHHVLKKRIDTIEIENLNLTFIDSQYFLANKKSFKLAEFSVFTGASDLLIKEYVLSGNSSYEATLTAISKSRRAIRIDPFIGFVSVDTKIQFSQYPEQIESTANIFPHITKPISQTVVNKTLEKYLQHFPIKANAVKQILELAHNNETAVFPIYGLDPVFQPRPEFNLFNLIASFKLWQMNSKKPLIVVLLNDIEPKSLIKLKSLFSITDPPVLANMSKLLHKTVMIVDVKSNHTLPNNLGENIYLINLGSLPKRLFDAVITKGLAVTEGANAEYQLLSVNKTSLPCLPQRSLDFHVTLNGFYRMPSDILHLEPNVCSYKDLSAWSQSPTPAEQLVPIIEKYYDAQIPQPDLPDRFAYLVSKVSEKKPTQNRFTFFQPDNQPETALTIFANFAIKSSLYSIGQHTFSKFLYRFLNIKNTSALIVSCYFRMGLQFLLEGADYDMIKIYFLSMLLRQVLLATNYNQNKILNFPFESAIMLTWQMSRLMTLDIQTLPFIGALILTNMLFDHLGAKAVDYMEEFCFDGVPTTASVKLK